MYSFVMKNKLTRIRKSGEYSRLLQKHKEKKNLSTEIVESDIQIPEPMRMPSDCSLSKSCSNFTDEIQLADEPGHKSPKYEPSDGIIQ